VLVEKRTVWEYAVLVVLREPTPDGPWPISATLFQGDGSDVTIEDPSNLARVLGGLGRDGWELVGAPEVASVVATHHDSGGRQRDRGYWVERRFWFKRAGASDAS
jgi:hypothetical protein